MSGKLFAAAIAAGALATAPAYAAPNAQSSNNHGAVISELVKTITGQALAQAASTCKQYTPGFLQQACEIDIPPGHCKGRGNGHDKGKGKGHDNDGDCPVSA